MGNATVFLAVTAFVTFAAIYGASTQAELFAAQEKAAESEYVVLARNAALAGFQRAEQHLKDDFTTADLEGTLDGVAYEVTVSVDAGQAAVISVGTYDDPRGDEDTEYTIRAMFEEESTSTVPPLPPYLSYGLMTGGNLNMTGTADILRAATTDGSAATTQVYVHANGNLNAQGASKARAFGSYAGSAPGNLSSHFRPDYNPDGLPTVAPGPIVEIPPVVATDIVDGFGGAALTLLPDQTLSGTLPGGTREEPLVYHALGNVSLNNVTFNGYVVIAAVGHVTVSGTTRATGGMHEGLEESALGIYTEQKVRLSGNSQLHAQIVAGLGMTFSGTTDVYGSIVTGNNLSLSGNTGIHYIPASAALAWEDRPSGGGGGLMLTYSEY